MRCIFGNSRCNILLFLVEKQNVFCSAVAEVEDARRWSKEYCEEGFESPSVLVRIRGAQGAIVSSHGVRFPVGTLPAVANDGWVFKKIMTGV